MSLISDLRSVISLFPDARSAARLAEAYRERLLVSLSELCQKVSKATGTDPSIAEKKIRELRKYHLNADLYALNYQMIRVLKEERSVPRLLELHQRLMDTPIESYIRSVIQVVTLDKRDWSLEFGRFTVKDANQIEGDN